MQIEVLCGMIGSGKSTYARWRAGQGALVVCHDDLARMYHAGTRAEGRGYELGLRDAYHEAERELAAVALRHGRPVVIDRTHLTRESRARWVTFAAGREPDVPVVAVVFPVVNPVLHAVRRFRADPRGRTLEDWIVVARHHAEQARREPPDIAEGFAEVRHVREVREACGPAARSR